MRRRKRRDACLTVTIIIVMGLNILFAITLFGNNIFSKSHYVYPSSFDGVGPYIFMDFRPAEEIVEFASLITNSSGEVISAIILGPAILENWAGLTFWILESETLRWTILIVWMGFIFCVWGEAYSGTISLFIVVAYGILEIVRLVVYTIGWTSKSWYATNPGDEPFVTPQFLIKYLITVGVLLYYILCVILMIIIMYRKEAMEKSRVSFQSKIGSSFRGRKYHISKRKQRSKRKRRNRRGSKNKGYKKVKATDSSDEGN